MNDFHIMVIFGSDQVRKFHNNEIFNKDEIDEHMKFYSFETKIELDAFIFGLQEANGWLDLVYLKEFEFSDPPTVKVIESNQIITLEKVNRLK